MPRSEIDTVSIEKGSTVQTSKYAFELTVNGETERYTYYDKQKRNRRFREYKVTLRRIDSCLCDN